MLNKMKFPLVSLERNTYGDLFIHTLKTADPLFDESVLVKYYNEAGTKWNYGYKVTSGNKKVLCMLFKESFEKGSILNESDVFLTELDNFDETPSSYAASFGHDDFVMAAVQLEALKQTTQYKIQRSEYESVGETTDETSFNLYDF